MEYRTSIQVELTDPAMKEATCLIYTCPRGKRCIGRNICNNVFFKFQSRQHGEVHQGCFQGSCWCPVAVQALSTQQTRSLVISVSKDGVPKICVMVFLHEDILLFLTTVMTMRFLEMLSQEIMVSFKNVVDLGVRPRTK